MNKSNMQKIIVTVAVAAYLLLYIGKICIMLVPMPSNMALTAQSIMLTSPDAQQTYIFDGINRITCYNRYPEYKRDTNEYMPSPKSEVFSEDYYTERTRLLNFFQKMLIIMAAKNVPDKIFASSGAYHYYKTADTPTTYGERLTFCIDGRDYFTDIIITGKWSNKYDAFCDKRLIELMAATVIGCPSPIGEKSTLEEWLYIHWWHMKRAH